MLGNTVEFILFAISIMAACGAVGYKIAIQQKRNPYVGIALAAFVPFIGLGILMILGKKSE